MSKFLSLVLVLGLHCAVAFAGWQGPAVVVEGSWGSDPGQFGLSRGDTIAYDGFPRLFGITREGKTVVADSLNKRMTVFNETGQFLISFGSSGAPGSEKFWPVHMFVCSDQFILSGLNTQVEIYNVDGDIVRGWTTEEVEGMIEMFDNNCNFITKVADNLFHKYSPTGDLLATYDERPLELGHCEEKDYSDQGEIKTRTTVKFDIDGVVKEWVIEEGTNCYHNFVLDQNGNLYSVDGASVTRYGQDGSKIAVLELPLEDIETHDDPSNPVTGEYYVLNAQYGSAVLAPNGDVYTWKRTEDKYCIIKWEWQD